MSRIGGGKGSRALALLEVVLGMAMLALLAGASLLAYRASTDRATARGIAEVLAEELRNARKEALVTGTPVALAFPSQNGTCPTCRGFCVLTGAQKGHVVRVRSLGNEYTGRAQEGCFFLGKWTGAAAAGDAATGSAGDAWTMPADWLPGPCSGDHCLIFTPDGRVHSNDLPRFGQDYRVLVARTVRHDGATPLATASAALEPQVVIVTPLGDVRVETASGLAGGATGAALLAALPVFGNGNNTPVVESLQLQPVTNDETNNPGESSASDPLVQFYPIPPGTAYDREYGPITLKVTASDADGDNLFYRWSVNPSQGAFSTAVPGSPGVAAGPMQFDSSTGKWTATCDWIPPPAPFDPDAPPHWDFVCTVTDLKATTNSSTLAVQPRVVAARRGTVAFDRTGGVGNGTSIYVMNIDGTGITRITGQAGLEDSSPDWSPTGDWIAFDSTDSADTSNLVMATGDGKSRVNLTNLASGKNIYPRWSPDGTLLAYLSDPDGNGVYSINIIDPATRSTSTIASEVLTIDWLPSQGKYFLAWSPNGKYLACLQDAGVPYRHYVHVYRIRPAPQIQTDATARNTIALSWAPGGGRLLCSCDDDNDFLYSLRTWPVSESTGLLDHSGVVTLLGEGVNSWFDAAWSPDSQHVAVSADPDNNWKWQILWVNANAAPITDSFGTHSPYLRLTVNFDCMNPVVTPDNHKGYLVFQGHNYLDVNDAYNDNAFYKLYRFDLQWDKSAPRNNIPVLSKESGNVAHHAVSR